MLYPDWNKRQFLIDKYIRNGSFNVSAIVPNDGFILAYVTVAESASSSILLNGYQIAHIAVYMPSSNRGVSDHNFIPLRFTI